MRIIAIDSSGLTASVALMEDDMMIAEYTVSHKLTHSQTLLPMLDEIKDMLGLELDTIDAIAVAAGPGSFTGLRIGSATAKGLALALDIPIVPVPTLEALAMNLWQCSGLVCPIMDARREQVYTGIYRFTEGKLTVVRDGSPMAVKELTDILNGIGEEVVFLGDGVPVYRDFIDAELKQAHSYAPAHVSRQRAGAVGALAMIYYREGRAESSADHRPDYMRVSQAERERSNG